MGETIETERLLLRPFADDDAARVFDILRRDEVVRWLGGRSAIPVKDLDEARERIAGFAKVSAGGGPYEVVLAIEVKGTGSIAGAIMIVPLPDGEPSGVQVGWYLHPDSAGRGYVTEAATALLDDAFARGLDEIWCDMIPDNAPSAAVAVRVGLRPLGVVPDPWYDGEGRVFHATREEWAAR